MENVLLTNAVSGTLGETDIPLFQLLSVLPQPSLRNKLLRRFEDVGIVVYYEVAYAENRLPDFRDSSRYTRLLLVR